MYEIDAQLNPLCSIAKDFSTFNTRNLVDYIINRYHEPLRNELPEISRQLAKMSLLYGNNYPELTILYDLFENFRKHLALHLAKEEMVVFPLCLGQMDIFSKTQNTRSSIETMLAEHEAQKQALNEMRRLTNDFVIPDGLTACQAVYERLSKIAEDMDKHIHLERESLFPLVKVD